ncbi:hypothetical protein L202_00302 [Cryptococcus amylolentus CBS 6039]|uniref:Galactinol synthase n=1 Tax=Cryptococcus amylolentus CBS 6039 TaxID=1295533 RepID=A0A1E3I758_9TREE|nr:hypothetical protein L202_00302 [Cryptococcus amylolentus CBS 6039]ODN84328.1 hypothetical protein L202_00302 [Cryptococcus amylolentus CBS 6039]
MTLSPPATPGSGGRAWVTLITNPSYVAGLLALHRTISSLSDYPLLVMTTPSLPESYQTFLKSYGFTLIPVSHLSPSTSQHAGFNPDMARLNDAWTKLQVFGLVEYDKVILIDADMIFLKDMDELFDLELPGRDWIGAAPACVCNPLNLEHYPKDWQVQPASLYTILTLLRVPENCSLSHQQSPTPLLSPEIPSLDAPRTAHLLNSGLVVLYPSTTLLDSLVSFLETSPTVAQALFADQDVIAEAFKGRWRPLPWWCNALKTLRGAHKALWKDEQVANIHYIIDKPWAARPASLPPHRPSSTMPSPDLPPSPASVESTHECPPSYAYLKSALTKRRALPPALLEIVRNTPEQESLTDYGEVHKWWWVVYEDVLEEMKTKGVEWEMVDGWVTR